MEESSLPGITPINCYNVEKGKLSASVKWLIGRVYGSTAPDLLVKPIRENSNNTFQLETAVVTGLTNASLYSNAAAKIFKDQSLINKSHSVVLRALANHSIPITLSGEEANINETMLSSVQPFHQAAHLAVIDSLMIAHMRSIITIDKVVEAVQNYTTVDKREEPMDSVDALLFWINKICLLDTMNLKSYMRTIREPCDIFCIRFNEKNVVLEFSTMVADGSVIVPEMEDLYEDMCDGACIYICFNDPMSLADCQYNLVLLRKFCTNLPWNPFHFEIEDILYLHESLQPNVNAFLADLFQIFEGDSIKSVASPVEVSPTRARCFAPIKGIPELRSQNAPNKALNQFRSRLQPEMSRTFSAMSSDSLMTNRSGESMKHHYQKNFTGPKTNFSELTQSGDYVNNISGFSQGGTYIRSDSMPAASIRLALEEKRREHEKGVIWRRTNQSESERAQKQKDAFFTLMQRLEKGSDTRARAASEIEMSVQQENLSRQVDEQRQMTHAISQPAIHTELGLLNEPNHALNSSYATLPHNMTKAMHQVQQHTYATPYITPMEPQLFGQSTHQSLDQNQPFPMHTQMPLNGYSNQSEYHSTMSVYPSHVVPNSQLSTPHYQLNLDGTYVLHPQDTTVHPVVGSPFMLNNAVANSTAVANNTFRLHRNDAPSSRLDPSLEINRNLTNWGLTYKTGQTIRPQRRTWENRTFTKSELDLSNQPEFLPQVPSSLQDQSSGPSENINGVKIPESIPFHQRDPNLPQYLQQADFDPYNNQSNISQYFQQSFRVRKLHKLVKVLHIPTTSFLADVKHISHTTTEVGDKPGHQQSPPKDPISSINADVQFVSMNHKLSSTRASQFIVDDAAEKPVINVTPEMEAKREALLAKTLRRREQIEQKNAERRQAELERQEAAEQRKRERELQRQRILDDYKRKKMEKELENNESPNGRGYSQPSLLSRPKSIMEGTNLRMKRSSRPHSSFEESSVPSSARILPSSARVPVASTAEPTLKLFSKYVHKSNRSMIINALQYSVFPGSVWDKQRAEVLGELAKSDSKHFLLLFRDQKCRYLGAYSWDQQSDTAHRIHGKGPNICHESMMQLMFKCEKFSQIPTKHLSATIDGFTLQDQFMQGPKIPHSSSSSRCQKVEVNASLDRLSKQEEKASSIHQSILVMMQSRYRDIISH
ncbi:Short spindle protein 4 [Dirofilaria immitis]|nr:Short spindle protein 4 [Dirofilaria immitis]